MKQSMTSFAAYDCIQLENAALALWLTVSAGPRIIGLSLQGGDNLLAVLPEAATTTPSGRHYPFRGGHRLWHAPEHAERTYAPEDAPVSAALVERGVQVEQPVEALTGIQKRLTIVLPDEGARLIIDHELVNHGLWPVELAPWAITQLRPGGFAILPQPTSDSGLLPNRRLALWPYTQANAPTLQWGDRYLFVQATMSDGRFKIGWANPAGWLAYWLDDTLFVKQAAFMAEATYYDFGSSSECYCDPRFLELETLGPRVTLAPGQATRHREVWSLYPVMGLAADEDAVDRLVSRLGLGPL